MTVSLRERRRQMLYDEILLAMSALLAEKGYAAISMEELAARVGISKPTLYSHFPTKEDILIASIRDSLDRVAAIIDADRTQRSPLQQLSFILKTVVQVQVNKGALGPRPWSPEIIQVICTRQEVLDSFRNRERAILVLVREAIANGEIDALLDPVLVMRTFYALLSALHAPFLSDMSPANPRTVAETLAAIFERGVRAHEP
jgi:AcrR family transcriptional regulator